MGEIYPSFLLLHLRLYFTPIEYDSIIKM